MTDPSRTASLLIRIVMRVVCPRDRREAIEGDLFELAAGHRGLRVWRELLVVCAVVLCARLRPTRPRGLGQDFTFAWRSVRRRPGFSAAVIATLALGIGGNAAIFSVVYGVLFKELPFEAGDRLVAVRQVMASLRPVAFLSARDFQTIAGRDTGLEHVAAVTVHETTLVGLGEPENLRTAFISPAFLPLLGVRASVGRDFRPDEYEVGHNASAIISHALWQRRFSGDTTALQRPIRLSGRIVQVIGVLPPGFKFVEPADVWLPLVFTPARLSNSGVIDLQVYARLRPGRDPAAVSRQLTAVLNGVDRQIRVEPLRLLLSKDVRASLLLFWAAVALVLLIACANVANLLLARAAERRREIAVRRALGVGAWRLVRQVLFESLLLSAAGGLAGLFTAYWAVRLLVAVGPATIPRLDDVGLDPAVVAFTVVLAFATGVAFGLAPALDARRVDVLAALRDTAAASRGGFSLLRPSARSVILIAEVAITLVLLNASGLVLRSFVRLQQIDAGFVADDAAAITVSVPIRRARERSDALQFFQRVTDRIAALPGVRAAGAASGLPLTRQGGRLSLILEGKPLIAAPPTDDPASGAPPMPPPPPPPAGHRQPVITPHADAIYTNVTAGYIETMGMAVRDGRTFNAGDRATSTPVVVISEAMATRYWPGERAIGRRLQARANRWTTIIGVVGNVRRFTLESEALPEIYLPISQIPPESGDIPEHNVEASEMTIVARGRGRAGDLIPKMRAQVFAAAPEQPVLAAFTLDTLLSGVRAPRRFNMVVLAAFGTAAVLLTVLGVYSLVAYLVAQRRREIGIRLALGARHRHILRIIAGEGLALVAVGLAAGVALSMTSTRLMQGLLFGVPASDPVACIAANVLVLGACAAATWLAARRARSVDPVAVMRQD